MRNFIDDINKVLGEKTCIIGVGNIMRQDDGAGCYITEELKKKIDSKNIFIINAEDVPENHVFRIAAMDFKNVIIIDAVSCGEAPGSVLFGRIDEFSDLKADYSTHRLSLFLTSEILKRSGKSVFLLGIAVSDTCFGEGLSGDVKINADFLLKTILNAAECYREPAYEIR